jgi:hypothetical protein
LEVDVNIKLRAFKGLAFLGALVLAGALTVSLAGAEGTGAANGDSSVSGKELVEELGLPALEYPVDLENGSCERAVDVDGVPYCLDSVAQTDAEGFEVVAEIRGDSPESDGLTEWRQAIIEAKAAVEALERAEASGDADAIAAAHERVQAALDHYVAVAPD